MINVEWTNADNLTVQNPRPIVRGIEVVTWKDFMDFLDDNAEDFDSMGEMFDKRLDALEDRLNVLTKQVSDLTIAVGRLEGITQPIDPNSPILLNGTWHSPDVLKWGSYYTVSDKTEEI